MNLEWNIPKPQVNLEFKLRANPKSLHNSLRIASKIFVVGFFVIFLQVDEELVLFEVFRGKKKKQQNKDDDSIVSQQIHFSGLVSTLRPNPNHSIAVSNGARV